MAADRSPLDIVIRRERGGDPSEVEAIAAVVAAAFASTTEAGLVTAIRGSQNYIAAAALVAEHHGRVVGHVMISHVGLRGPGVDRGVACLSPLAVAPDVQRRGIGSALVRDAVAVADSLGEPVVVLQGDPRFYSRLGFEPSSPCGIELNLPHWAPPEAAQLIKLATYDPTLTGTVIDPPYFQAAADARST